MKGDVYKEKWSHLKMICTLYHNMIAGSYVNFAICESYDDDIFTVISKLVVNAMSCQEYKQLKSYEKVNRRVFTVSLHFF